MPTFEGFTGSAAERRAQFGDGARRKRRQGQRKKNADQPREECKVLVRANGVPASPENSAIVDLSDLPANDTEAFRTEVADLLFEIRDPAAARDVELYYDDGVVVASTSLLGDGAVLFAARTAEELFVGSVGDAHPSAPPPRADTEKEVGFIPAAEWDGPREGFYFGATEEGVGYHWCRVSRGSRSSSR
eukprot:Hpha_TRINITY_DN35150_c0_g1::TRINITY_DN35150_c0_g1_i1::g.168469::m.168469